MSAKRWNPLIGGDEQSIPHYTTAHNQGYYNWFAATAGSGVSSTVSTSVSDSVCPSGWQLPIEEAGSNNSYSNMLSASGSLTYLTIRKYPFSFVLPGYMDEHDFEHLGQFRESAHIWTATSISESDGSDRAYELGIWTPWYNNSIITRPMTRGNSVRCVNVAQSNL